MPIAIFNDVKLYYEEAGSGQPLVLVHGSWTDHHSWDLVAPSFAERFRVITYDRRGYSQSERPAGQGSLHVHVADLAALIEGQGLGKAANTVADVAQTSASGVVQAVDEYSLPVLTQCAIWGAGGAIAGALLRALRGAMRKGPPRWPRRASILPRPSPLSSRAPGPQPGRRD